MSYIENQLGEMLQALKDGTVTADMLHRINLGSIDGLRAAVINRSQEQLKTFLAMGDFRPLLFNSDGQLPTPKGAGL